VKVGGRGGVESCLRSEEVGAGESMTGSGGATM